MTKTTTVAAGNGAVATVLQRRRVWHRATASQSAERISDSFAKSTVTESGEEDVLERGGGVACAQSAGLSPVDDHTSVEQHDLVACGTREMEILGREQDTTAACCKRRDRFAQHDDRLGVERGGGLIDEDEGWEKAVTTLACRRRPRESVPSR